MSEQPPQSNPTPKIFEIHRQGSGIYTQNLTPGKTFFNEKTAHINGVECRELDPKHSKLGAAILKGCPNIFMRKGSIVLYLGASHGYTPSYVSDIVGNEGFVFALDNAPRVVRDLVFLCKDRINMAPILASANHPEEYNDKISQVDIIYQDIAQKNQAEILLKNIDLFLKPGGYALIAVKARSIDVRRNPKELFEEVRIQLEKKLTIVDFRTLDPYELDHCFIICKKR